MSSNEQRGEKAPLPGKQTHRDEKGRLLKVTGQTERAASVADTQETRITTRAMHVMARSALHLASKEQIRNRGDGRIRELRVEEHESRVVGKRDRVVVAEVGANVSATRNIDRRRGSTAVDHVVEGDGAIVTA